MNEFEVLMRFIKLYGPSIRLARLNDPMPQSVARMKVADFPTACNCLVLAASEWLAIVQQPHEHDWRYDGFYTDDLEEISWVGHDGINTIKSYARA